MRPLLYVDGYNVIGAWHEAERNEWSLAECRDRLIHLLADYGGYSGQEIVLVFDGYRTDRMLRTEEKQSGITVVYTRQGETADRYIERMVHLLPSYREARVASSDGIEQTLILGRGATRLSAREFWGELTRERMAGHRKMNTPSVPQKTSFTAALTEEQFAVLEKLRRQK